MSHRAPSRPGRDKVRPSRVGVRSGQPREGPVTPQSATHAAGGATDQHGLEPRRLALTRVPLVIVSRKDANVSNQNL
jgi:hypothetical protein